MLDALAELLPFAFGLVAAPMPVVVVIVLLMSQDGRARAFVFVAGWFATVVVLAGLVAMLSGAGGGASDGDPPLWVGLVQLVVGLAMLAMAAKTVRDHSARGPAADSAQPAWLGRIDALTPVKALGLAAVLSGLNPKSLAMVVGAGTSIGALGLDAGAAAFGVLVFAVLGSLGVLVPVLAAVTTGARGATALQGARSWLTAHNDAVTMTVMFVFGGVFLAKALRTFAG